MGMTRELDALNRVLDTYRDEHDGFCKFCDSFPHADGSISHDEDCPIPYVEKAVGE